MASSASSAISRYHPSVILTASLAAAGSIYFVYCVATREQALPHVSSLHRSNAVRRRHVSPQRARTADLDRLLEDTEQIIIDYHGNEVNDSNASTLGGGARETITFHPEPTVHEEAETEQSVDEQSHPREGSRLQELVYAIAKNNSEKEGVVHRGVTCDKCNRVPIVGVRYHCANCPDYDLCEECEATDCHLKTHVFYKVKIPSPWGGKKPLPLWYPGDPTSLPSELLSRSYRNHLSSTTGFPLSKIDGLYQQFTCMANAPLERPDESGVRMGIDRAAFDHCFIGQTMTDRPVVPNLIHDRLFSFYDRNGDGVVDFTEFVEGTGLVHHKSTALRLKRVFRGLDLDEDGFISRSDCLKIFRAYYELNKDIMLGYLGIEREGQNADLVLADREPSRHVVSGRSLASYFNEGAPGGFQTNHPTSGKVLDRFNDYVPRSSNLDPITGEGFTNVHDFMGQNEAAEGAWLNLWAVFNDEVFRLCAGKPLKWLIEGNKVRIFARSVRGAQRSMIEHNGELWAADGTYFGKSAYIKVEDEDLRGISNNAAELRDKLSDPVFHLTVHHAARQRLCYEIRDAMYTAGKAKVEERAQHSQFYLDDPTVLRPGTNKELNGSKEARRASSRTGNEADESNPTETSTSPASHNDKYKPPMFIGGTAAAHTIYNVVEDALNEMLDPLFKPGERLAIEVEKTAPKREQHRDEINAYIESSRAKIEPIIRGPYHRTEDQSAKLFKMFFRTPGNPDDVRNGADGGAMVAAAYDVWYSKQPSTNVPKTDISDRDMRDFFEWLLKLEAELMVGWEVAIEATEEATREADAARIRRVPKPKVPAGPAFDPTMPQHRPSTEPLADGDGAELPVEELLRLTRLEAVASIHRSRGKPGVVDFDEFERKMELTEENGNTLLQWIGGWVDLVMF